MYEVHKRCALIRNERLGLLQVMREVLLKGCNLKAPSRPRNWQVQRPWGRKHLLCARTVRRPVQLEQGREDRVVGDDPVRWASLM